MRERPVVRLGSVNIADASEISNPDSTGFTVFSAVSGISRPQFYNPFSTVFLHPLAANDNNNILN